MTRTGAPHDSVLVFCRSLLEAAVADAEVSVAELTRLFVALRVNVRSAAPDGSTRGSSYPGTARILDALLGHMQFFDEHAQRVRHVAAILALLEHSGPEDVTPGGARDLLDRIRGLLSTQSEWGLLAEVMGEDAVAANDTGRVELF